MNLENHVFKRSRTYRRRKGATPLSRVGSVQRCSVGLPPGEGVRTIVARSISASRPRSTRCCRPQGMGAQPAAPHGDAGEHATAPPCDENGPPATPSEEREPPILAERLRLLGLAEPRDGDADLLATVLAIDSLVASLAPRHAALCGKLHAAFKCAFEGYFKNVAAGQNLAAAAAVSPTQREHSESSPVCGSVRAKAREKAREAKTKATGCVRKLDIPASPGVTGLADVIVQLGSVPWEDVEAAVQEHPAGANQLVSAITLQRTGKTRRPRPVARPSSPMADRTGGCCPDQHFGRDFWQRGQWVPRLLSYSDLPEWRKAQANELIREGYRQETSSYKECVRSWLYLHNESFNIHSHLWPAVATVPIAAFTVLSDVHQRGAPPVDALMCLPFFVGAFGCLFLSAMFHTMYECCERSASCFAKLDYIGITLLIYGSNWPAVHFMFYCRPELQLLYLASITVLCVPTVVVVVADRFAGESYKGLRAGLFSTLGLTALAPIIHFSVRPGLPLDSAVFWSYLLQMIAMGCFYLVGALLYALSMPERFCPGKLDYFGNAHNIFHVLVLAGVATTYSAFAVLFDEVEANGFQAVCVAFED